METQVEDIIFHRGEPNVYHVILPPSTHSGDLAAEVDRNRIGGNTYVYGAPPELNGGEAFTMLHPGHQLTLNLNLDREQITEDWANKTIWVHGLKDIPPVDTWDYATDDGLGNGFVGLKWNGQVRLAMTVIKKSDGRDRS